MKKPKPDGSIEGANGSKAFAHQLVSQYTLGIDKSRFSVVSFAENATTRVPWSYNVTVINAGIDAMTADGRTSISDGFEAVRHLFANDGRVNATKIVLLLSDGEQTIDAATGKTLLETAVEAAALVKGDNVTVFAWGFGDANASTLQQIATDPSKAILASNLAELTRYLDRLKDKLCFGEIETPAFFDPPSPPPPSPP
eukprot:scaffold91065_cov63-Phaeocystis_antarctica.AAC.1